MVNVRCRGYEYGLCVMVMFVSSGIDVEEEKMKREEKRSVHKEEKREQKEEEKGRLVD